MAHFPETPNFTGFNTPSRIEADIADLQHTGTIPPELDGAFYRVQPDPQFPPRLGDDISFNGETHPRVLAWYQRLRRHPICGADLERTRSFLETAGPGLQRPQRIVWRGDRIEWLLAHGFHDWFLEEIRSGRVAWPRRMM